MTTLEFIHKTVSMKKVQWHGFQFLCKEGTMAIILPHGVLFRGGAEERIRIKLLKNNNRRVL